MMSDGDIIATRIVANIFKVSVKLRSNKRWLTKLNDYGCASVLGTGPIFNELRSNKV